MMLLYFFGVFLRLKKVVKSLGVGPWGAGLSFGDSELGFLATWIGHAAAAGVGLLIFTVKLAVFLHQIDHNSLVG